MPWQGLPNETLSKQSVCFDSLQDLQEAKEQLILEMAEMKKYGPESIASDMEAPCDNLEIDQIMAKLEQDNKFLEDLEKQRSSKAVNKANSDSSSSSSSNNQRFVKKMSYKQYKIFT